MRCLHFVWLLLVMDDSRIRNRKSRFFPRIEKNRNLDFITSLCIDFYWRGIHLYSIGITWRHFGKLEIVAVINKPILLLRASLQIRQLLTGHTTQGDQRTFALHHPPRERPMWSTYRRGWRGGRRETVTWYEPPRDTKTAGAVVGVGHQRQMTPHSPPPARSDNNSQLSITLTFLLISLSLRLTERASWFVTIGRNSNNYPEH